MKYFRQEDGKYISSGVPGIHGGSPFARILLPLLPMLIIAGIYLGTGEAGSEMTVGLPILIMGAFFILSLVFAAVLRRKGHGSGIVVDQMKGTVIYRRPGNARRTVPVSSIREIGFYTPGENKYGHSGSRKGSAVLFLRTKEGEKLPIAYSGKPEELKHFADELSIVSSLTVSRYTGNWSDL